MNKTKFLVMLIIGICWTVNTHAKTIWQDLDAVIATHNQLLIAAEDLRTSQLNLSLATAEFYPSLNLDYQLLRQENQFQGLAPSQYQSAMQLQLEAYLFKNGFTLWDQVTLKQKELQATGLMYQKVGQELKSQLLKMYLDYYMAYKNYELHNSQLQFYEKSLKLTEQAYAKGDKSKLECSVIQVEVDLEKDLITQDELTLAELYLRLEQDFPKIFTESATPDIQIEEYLNMGIITQNITTNLDLLLLKKSIEIADQKLKISESTAMPSLKLFLSKIYSNTQNSMSDLQADLLKESNNTMGVKVNIPLFDPKIGPETEKQNAQKTQKYYAEQELQKNLKLQLQEKLSHFIQNTKRYTFLKEKLVKAKENCVTAELLYQKGIISFLQFREYYLAEQRVRENLLNTECLIFTSILELKKLTGSL